MSTRLPLQDQVALVTGAGGGVGRGLALAFAAAGANVVLAVRRPSTGMEVAAEITATSPGVAVVAECDVTDPGALRDALVLTLDRFGRLDHLVHNATCGRSSDVNRLETVDVDLFREHSAVALRALYHLATQSFDALRAARGSLLVMTSPAGIEGSATLPLYATVKGAQRGFVKALAREWGPEGVRVNAIAPLAVTPALAKAYVENVSLKAKLEAITPLGRIGEPYEDIGPPAVFLCSAAASYITGQTLVVSGGRFTSL